VGARFQLKGANIESNAAAPAGGMLGIDVFNLSPRPTLNGLTTRCVKCGRRQSDPMRGNVHARSASYAERRPAVLWTPRRFSDEDLFSADDERRKNASTAARSRFAAKREPATGSVIDDPAASR